MKSLNYWEPVFKLLIKYEADFCYSTDVIRIIDYFYNNKQSNINGNLRIKMLTPVSVRRRVEMWHEQLFIKTNQRIEKQEGSKIKNANFNYDGIHYSIMQLTSNFELFLEGKSLSHCVNSYAYKCMDGRSSIWSLREIRENKDPERLCMIELSENKIIQLEGNITGCQIEKN